MKDIPNRIRLTKREDGYIISTVKSYDNWHGAYETAIMLEVLEFIFQDIIHFIGTILLLETIGNMFKKK